MVNQALIGGPGLVLRSMRPRTTQGGCGALVQRLGDPTHHPSAGLVGPANPCSAAVETGENILDV